MPAASDFAHLNYTGLAAWQDGEAVAGLDTAAGLPAGFARAVLPRPRSAATVQGYLADYAARELGLPARLPVITGSSDGTSAMYGAGVCLPGTAACVSGTTDVLMAQLAARRHGPDVAQAAAAAGLSLNTGMEPGYGLAGGAMGLSAAALRHFAALTFGTPDLDVSSLEEAATVPAGADDLLALPGLTGERAPYWHQEIGGGLYGLRLDHGRAHILRAVMEAAAYRLRAVLDGLATMGVKPARLLISGGGAGSAVWNRIRADVTGVPLERTRSAEATCLGAAMFARQALDPGLSLAAISAEWIGAVDRLEPDGRQAAVYARGRARFEGLIAALSRFEEEP